MQVGEVIRSNDKTGRSAIYVGDGHISIFHGGHPKCSTKVEKIGMQLHRYGRSKVMHWNDVCAAPNANAEPDRIDLLDGLLAGYKTCRNCFGRTGFYHKR